MDIVVKLMRENTLKMATAESAVTALRSIIENLSPETGGQLTSFDGEIISW
jgi:hypothetical protein